MHPELDRLATELWDFSLENSPSSATLLGDHRFDHLIEDHSEAAEQRRRAALVGFVERAEAIDPSELSRAEWVTRAMLLARCRQVIDTIDSEIAEMRSDQLVGPHASLLRTSAQWAFPEPEHARAAIERLRALPTALEQALGRFRAAVRKGRPPARINVERSISLLDGYLASPLDSDIFASLRGPEGWDGEGDWRALLHETVRQTIRPAFQRYRDGFEAELLPVARPDEKSGLVWVEGGEAIYANAITEHTTLELDATQIHEIGLEEIAVKLAAQYAALGDQAFGTADVGTVLETLRSDPDLRFSSPEEIMEMAREILARAKATMGDWFGVLPKADCIIAPVPDFIAGDMPAAYYLAPAPDGSRPGTYFVNLANPGDKMRYQAEAIGFHEAIPGHHLQLAIAGELEHIPMFQRHMGTTAYAEGWGLYAERLADEQGLYSDVLQQLGMLSTDSWRAGRLVVDTGIHAKGWSRQQAIEFLHDNSAVTPQEVEVEVDRYIGWPGQALAYKLGQREIFRLRDHAAEALGDRFDIKGFHDTVLTSGPVTLPILAALVDDWVGAGA